MQTKNHNHTLRGKSMMAAALLCLCAVNGMSQDMTPHIHGILRGKYEYQPDMHASRFEVRNARLSAEGKLPLRSSYKLEVDLCDESQVKMKDAWVRLTPWNTLRATVGQQRMPFSIDAHRNPSVQYFANRSFIAKQVGDMRDVGFQLGYDFLTDEGRKVISLDAGLFNGSNLDNQKTAWFKAPGYSARAQFIYTFPRGGKMGVVPSVQHQQIAGRQANYTSVDFGAYYEIPLPEKEEQGGSLHLEAEFLRKFYSHHTFSHCSALNAMAIYKMPVSKNTSEGNTSNTYLSAVSYLLRYDYMGNHSDGKQGFTADDAAHLVQTDAERHRLTAGVTLHINNTHIPTALRLNYEKYWYPHGGTPKESEQDKLVAELMIRF